MTTEQEQIQNLTRQLEGANIGNEMLKKHVADLTNTLIELSEKYKCLSLSQAEPMPAKAEGQPIAIPQRNKEYAPAFVQTQIDQAHALISVSH